MRSRFEIRRELIHTRCTCRFKAQFRYWSMPSALSFQNPPPSIPTQHGTIRLQNLTAKTLAVLAVLALSGPAFEARSQVQGIDIRGVVSDSLTGERLPYTNVILLDTRLGAASSLEGFYLIGNVPPGTYRVAASAVGYERKIVEVVVGRLGPVVVNFDLNSKVVEFGEVVVTESGKRELLEVNTSVHIMEAQDIQRVPATVVEDVLRSIQTLPGIVSTSDVNARFYVRGGASDQNLILLDGMKIYNPFHAFGVFSVFDSDIIKSTEVYTGAFPPGFGGRLSSVVNLATRDGKSTRVGGTASINFLSGKVGVEGPALGSFQWMASGRKTLFPQTFTKFFGQNVPLDFYDAFFKVSRQSGDESRLSLQGFFSGDNLLSADPETPDYRWKTSAIGVNATGLVSDRLFVRVVGFSNRFEAKRDPKQSRTATPASSTVDEVNVRADATYYTDSRDLYFFGFEFNFPKMEYRLINTFGVENTVSETVVETWMWARYQTTTGRLKFDGGLHVDVASMLLKDFSPFIIQPRINMSYALNDPILLKASYGRFSQNMITINNEDDVIALFDAWVPIPEDLDPERADHYVAGVDWTVLRELSAGLQGYYKNYVSLVTYNQDKVDADDPDYVNSTGEAYGAEVLLRFGSPVADLYAAYTLGWTTIESNGFTYAPRYDRRHTVNLMAVVRPWERVEFSARWEYGSGLPYTQTAGYYDRLSLGGVFEGSYVNETGSPYTILGEKNTARLPAYHRLDLSGTYRFSLGPLRGSFGISIINVYDHENIIYYDRDTGEAITMLSFFPSATLTLEY